MKPLINDIEDPLPLGRWRRSLLWCPSQCYLHIRRESVDYVLYLRWRYGNPWHGYIIANAQGESTMTARSRAVWSGDLLNENGQFYRSDQMTQAEQAMEKLFEKYLKDKPAVSEPSAQSL